MSAHRIAACLVAALLVPTSAAAQFFFGQNKVQYNDFDWQVMRTPHLELHFYPEEEELARWVATDAEETTVELIETMNLDLERPIPFLLYSTPGTFQQTNASPFLIAEEVGGLTDLIKGRVLVPHNGSYHMLRWVVRHELVHACMLAKLSQVLKANKKTRYSYPPLWYVEGLAEYLGGQWDARADMILRDAAINDTLVPIPEMWRINGTFQMYKQGQSILMYVAREFGEDKVMQVLEDWHKDLTFEELVEDILGIDLETLSERWEEDVKRHYFPQVRTRDSIEIFGDRLIEHGRFNLKPCPLPPAVATPDSSRPDLELTYLSSFQGFANIRYAAHDDDIEPPSKPELLVKGGTSEQFESLHFFRSSMDANRAREIVFVARQGQRDVLHIFHVDQKELVATLTLPGLVGLQSPAWSPDGRQIVFAGVGLDGHRDLWVVDRSGADLKQLTDDHFDDVDPDWAPNGRHLVFASDRCAGGAGGAYNLYLYDLAEGSTTALTAGNFEDGAPAWSPDGAWVAFRSNRRQGAFDLYVTNLAGEIQNVAACQTALLDPEWVPAGDALVCTSFIKGAFGIFRVQLDPAKLPAPAGQRYALAGDAANTRPPTWQPAAPDTAYAIGPYRRRFGLDIVTGGVGYDPDFGGSAGGGQIVFSDLLGNERLQFFLANDGGDGGGNFLESFDVGFTYLNLARRLNWGIGAFRLARTYNADLDLFLREARMGGVFLASYPLSRFNRLETSIVARATSDHFYRRGTTDDTFFVSNFLSYVHDSTLWNRLGPFDGSRYNATVGITTDVGKGIGDFTSVQVDYRRYHRLLPTLTYAVRGIGRFTFGDEGQSQYVGGPHTLRGYPRRSLVGKRLMLVNQELRFPIVERLVMNLPLGLLELPPVNGALFVDAAWAGDPGEAVDPIGSFGAGIFIGGGPYPRLRIDYTRRTDFETLVPGTDTEFSVGFNF